MYCCCELLIYPFRSSWCYFVITIIIICINVHWKKSYYTYFFENTVVNISTEIIQTQIVLWIGWFVVLDSNGHRYNIILCNYTNCQESRDVINITNLTFIARKLNTKNK